MRLLVLTSGLEHSDGWGRYSLGFIAEARKRFGADAVDVVDPAGLRSKVAGQLGFGGSGLLRDLRQCLPVAKQVDVIHAMTEPLAPLAMMLSWLTGKPFLVSVHGTYGDARAYPRHLRPLYRAAFRRAARVVAVSGYTAEVVRSTFGIARVEIVPGGYSPTSVATTNRTLGHPPRLLSVGALKKRKGYHTLLAALGLRKKSGMSFSCRIIGARLFPDYARQLDDLMASNQLAEVVTLEHDVSDATLDRAYAEADLFILPSEHDGLAFEGLGLVYLEALAHGTPVIGSRQSGAEDVIIEGGNGMLVDPGKPELLAEAIKRALSDPERWRRMSVQAPESVARFAWDRVGARMAEIYNNVCASKA